jgi:hypothetical protein
MSAQEINKGERMMTDKHIAALLKIQLEHDLKMDKLDEALGRQCDIHEIFPLDLLDIVADLLGVPQDNFYELNDKLNMEEYVLKNNEYPKEYYSRDWVWDRWLECGESEDPINSFINTMKKDIAEYYKENRVEQN